MGAKRQVEVGAGGSYTGLSSTPVWVLTLASIRLLVWYNLRPEAPTATLHHTGTYPTARSKNQGLSEAPWARTECRLLSPVCLPSSPYVWLGLAEETA